MGAWAPREVEKRQFENHLTAKGRRAGTVRAGREGRVPEGIRAVFEPAGKYVLGSGVLMLGGLTRLDALGKSVHRHLCQWLCSLSAVSARFP